VARTTRHIVFGEAAAIGLRKALRNAGFEDDVLLLADDLSFGPIDPPESGLRAQWVNAELGYLGWDETEPHTTAFWIAALPPGIRRLAWMSRRSAREYSGFLEFVRRLGRRSGDIVDLTDMTIVNQLGQAEFAGSLGALLPQWIVERTLWASAQPLTSAMRASYVAEWAKLRGENAPLRIVDEGLRLRSAPISFFDEAILARATDRWQKTARIVGDVLSAFWRDGRYQTGDLVLMSRIKALADAGRLEAQGDLSEIRFSEVRLPMQQG
jgi:hypothetical protein